MISCSCSLLRPLTPSFTLRSSLFALPMWRAEGLVFRYPGESHPSIAGISLSIDAGSSTAVIGPNGSGKTTLLRILLGVLQPQEGKAWYGGRPLTEWSRAEIARQVGVVPQVEELAFPIAVREMVAMGRYPHLGSWTREGAADRQAIAQAMERCDVADLSARPFAHLSGGERQRVRIARALAQEPAVLALDEPTAALDISHEMAIFELLAELERSGTTIILTTHNLNLASRYAGRLLLLDRGRVAAAGPPVEVMRQDLLQEVYRWPVRTMPHPGPGPDTGAPQVTPLSPDGR